MPSNPPETKLNAVQHTILERATILALLEEYVVFARESLAQDKTCREAFDRIVTALQNTGSITANDAVHITQYRDKHNQSSALFKWRDKFNFHVLCEEIPELDAGAGAMPEEFVEVIRRKRSHEELCSKLSSDYSADIMNILLTTLGSYESSFTVGFVEFIRAALHV